MKYRIVFGVCGATGMPLAQAVLSAFKTLPDLDVHVIVSKNAGQVLDSECERQADMLTSLGTYFHDPADFSAGPASGSWTHDGMIICPCSMSSLASIAHGCGTNLVHRAADVTLKERRPLILAVRETPLTAIHLKNMQAAIEGGAIIMPFMPAFYRGPLSLDIMMLYFAGRLLDQLRIPHGLIPRWKNNQ